MCEKLNICLWLLTSKLFIAWEKNVPVSLIFISELQFQASSPANEPWQISLCVHSCKGLDALVCLFHIHSYSAFSFGFRWLPTKTSLSLPTPTLSSQCKTVWLMFPTVTLLSESWPRRRRREWGTFTSVMSWNKGTHAQGLDATNIYPCKVGCTAYRRHLILFVVFL